MLKNSSLFFSAAMMLLLMPAFCTARSIEDEFNTRIFIKNLTNLGAWKGIHSINWSPDGTRLLIDRQEKGHFYTVQLLNWEKLLDEAKDAAEPVSDKRNGSFITQNWNNSTPSWDKDGRYIIFSGQNEFARNLSRSGPFFGMECDLWIMDSIKKKFQMLKPAYPDEEKVLGATAADLSPDNRLLLWTVTVQPPATGRHYGSRRLVMAPIFLGNDTAPKLSRQVHFIHIPGENDFAESYGFTPDGTRILFSANLTAPGEKAGSWFEMALYSWDIKTKGSTPQALTSNRTWNRHASFSPKGKKIIWSCGAGFLQPSIGMQGPYWYKYLSTELWIMDADGKNPKKLTRFNDRLAPEFLGRRCYVGTSAWHPDGNKIAVIVNTESKHFIPESHLFIVELESGIRTPGGAVVSLKELRDREKKKNKQSHGR